MGGQEPKEPLHHRQTFFASLSSPPMRRLLLLTPLLLLAACAPVTPGPSASSSSVSSLPASPVVVSQPLANAVVTSPLTVQGEARGPWYFEASFPVHLLDGHGTEIATAAAQAQGDWMTEDFVPFQVTLTFTPPATATGTLVLEKDNPSGDPLNDASVSIPVAF